MMPAAKRAGFTLVELLVAMAIFSIIAVISVRAVASSLENRARIEQESRKWRDLTALLVTLESDLANAISGSGLPFFGTSGSTGGNDAWIAFSRAGRDNAGTAPMPPRGTIYRLASDGIERGTYHLTDVALTPFAPAAGTIRFPVAVRAITLRYLSDSGAWLDRWSATTTGMPRAVEIKLDLAGTERISRVFALQ